MRCRECRENIPDNVKYCPECGALVNNITYTYKDGNYAQPQIKYNRYAEDEEEQPKKISFGRPVINVRTPKKAVIFIFIAIIFFYLVSFAAQVINEYNSGFTVDDFFDTDSFEEEVIIDYESDYTPESVMHQYISNITDCDMYQYYDSFLADTALDWESIYRDFYTAGYDSSSENRDFAVTPLNAAFDTLNSIYPEDFTPYFFSTWKNDEYIMSDAEYQAYCDLIRQRLFVAGLNADNYFDFSCVEKAYNMSCDVVAEDENVESQFNVGTFTVIVVEYDGCYSVLYDDTFIQGLLDNLGLV